MYVVLVGRAGLGKGAAIRPALALVKEANTANVLSDRSTIEFILERLSKGYPLISATQQGNVVIGKEAACLISATELAVFMSASQFTLPIMAQLWDSEDNVEYSTRSKGVWPVKSPSVCLLGGSTQEWLISTLPTDAVGGGFTRRVNFVFGRDREQVIHWPSAVNHGDMKKKLVNDLKHISMLRGEFKFAPEARPLFEKAYNESQPADFDDEAVSAFKTTKWAHSTKLAMVLSVCRNDSKIISKQDFEQAVDKVEEVTKTIRQVFRAVGESDLVSATDRVMRFLEIKGFATRNEILRANIRHISGADLDTILITLVQAGILGEQARGNTVKYEILGATTTP